MDRWKDGQREARSTPLNSFFEESNSIFDWSVTDEIKAKVTELLTSKTPVFDEKFEFLK